MGATDLRLGGTALLRILTGCLLFAMLAGTADAADYGRQPAVAPVHGTGVLPACAEPAVLARITEKFAYQDARITRAGLAITGIDGIRQRALKAGGPSLTNRRYCGGTAWLSNGRSSEVV